jgi:hypothetical protein
MKFASTLTQPGEIVLLSASQMRFDRPAVLAESPVHGSINPHRHRQHCVVQKFSRTADHGDLGLLFPFTGFVQLDVDQKPEPQSLHEVEHKPLFSVQKSETEKIAIEKIQNRSYVKW